MRNYINGCSFPKFRVTDLINNTSNEIELDFTDETGLIEDIQPIYINHELIDYTNLQSIQGYHIAFSLPYESYSSKANSLKIKTILDCFLSNHYKIELTPREEFPLNTWEVVLLNDSIKYGINKGGTKAQGNRLINLQLKTKYLLKESIHWYDLDEINTTIEDFITTN